MKTKRKSDALRAIVVITAWVVGGVCCPSLIAQTSQVILPDHSPDPNRNRIIFVGDSSTRGVGCFDPDFQSFPSLISQYLFFRGLSYDVVNAGIPGDTAAGVLARIDPYLDSRAALVFLEIGTHDADMHDKPAGVFPSLPDLEKRIGLIISKVQSAKIPLVLFRLNYPETIEYVRQFVAMYDHLGKLYGVPVIDLIPPGLFKTPGVHASDGHHFNEIGYRRIAAHIVRALNPAFQPTEEELTVPNETSRLLPWIEYFQQHPGQLDTQ